MLNKQFYSRDIYRMETPMAVSNW